MSAVAADRDRDRVDDPRDDLPRRDAGVLLRPRPRVHRDRVDALALGAAGDLHGVHGALVPAAADLDREADADRLAHRAEDDGGAERVAHQRGALALGDDLGDRTAHVEIDGVGAGRLEAARRLSQHVGVGAQELHGDRMLLGEEPRQLLGARAVLEQSLGVDLLVGERAGAALAADEPERRVGDGGHRRQTQIDHGLQHLTWGGRYSTMAIARTGEPSAPSSLSGSATNRQRGAPIWSRLVRYSITVMPAGKKIACVVYSSRPGRRRGSATVSRMQ